MLNQYKLYCCKKEFERFKEQGQSQACLNYAESHKTTKEFELVKKYNKIVL